MKSQNGKPTSLYSDFAFAWSLSGMTVIRARSAADAAEKFSRLSRATMLNQADGGVFISAPVSAPSAKGQIDKQAESQ